MLLLLLLLLLLMMMLFGDSDDAQRFHRASAVFDFSRAAQRCCVMSVHGRGGIHPYLGLTGTY
jgi:hypothetical protein